MKKIEINAGNYDANIYEVKTGETTVWVPLIHVNGSISKKLEEFKKDCVERFEKEFNHSPEYFVVIKNNANHLGILVTDDKPVV